MNNKKRFQDKELTQKLSLTKRQKAKTRNASANRYTDIKPI